MHSVVCKRVLEPDVLAARSSVCSGGLLIEKHVGRNSYGVL
jgi:hypothetical protein